MSGTLELKLSNGKSITSTKGEELANFLDSRGASIVNKRKGGKSKGARNRTKSKAVKVA
jgi:hypothetical protein